LIKLLALLAPQSNGEKIMRIAVSGTHFMGKSTLIEDFIHKHPHYRCEVEPYYQLQNQKEMELSLDPSMDSLIEQLDFSIEQLFKCANQQNIILIDVRLIF
jgi:uridine kinase